MNARSWILISVALLGGCGGGGGVGGGTVGAPTPVTTMPAGLTVQVRVFYDENDSGTIDGAELVRVPEVEVAVGGRTGTTQQGSGLATIQGVAAGTHTVEIRSGLPPHWAATRPVTLTAPQASVVDVPVRINIGPNRPNVYVAFGDSITAGEGATAGGDYPIQLQGRLVSWFGDGLVINRGATGTNSFEALERFNRNIGPHMPGYVMVLYGTNDWNEPRCQDIAPCFTVDNLFSVVTRVHNTEAHTVLGLLPPVNPAVNDDRNKWVRDINGYIRTMGEREGAIIADLYQAFENEGGDLSRFFADGVHFNASGYDVIARGFFTAIAGRPAAGVTSRSRRVTSWPELFVAPAAPAARPDKRDQLGSRPR